MTDKERKTPELIYKETETKQGYKLITEIWLNYNEDLDYLIFKEFENIKK